MPAHITALYPFLPADRITDDVLRRLRDLCAPLPVLEVEFRKTGRFPNAFYLDPEPADGLLRLTALLVEAWPEAPPYGGRFEHVIPHLTVDENARVETHLPFKACLEEAGLYEFVDGIWRLRDSFPFDAQQ